ncbi:TIGR04219 family outer membrane beta-barrel protein [Paraglaciecola sp. 20A4]|uniref:TIGR04219 family outer membrane beta-barrel protein n=1 Tax=Paraglaciecola sp. 20A4 TaxID=2687288 RepID=UPI001409B0B2|nr:TIGR04219 family outer membrane beta-barrel protein [Paraglaciecola sp. 20A4]
MNKPLCAGALAMALTSLSSQADTLLGVYAGAQAWDMETTGGFSDSNNNVDFNFDDETKGSFYVALEHPVPFVPNIKLQRTGLDTNGQTVLSSSMTYGGELFSADTTVNTSLDLVSTDYIAYYELFDNDLVSFDLGINAKHLDGDIYLEAKNDATQNAARDFSGFVPMLYSRVEVGVPFTGLGAFVEGSFLAFDDNKITDYQAAITYGLLDNLAIDATLQLGYRSLEMELDDLDGIYTDFEFSGAFVGVEVHF